MITDTHCPLGHEYTPENTITYHDQLGRLRRICRACDEEIFTGAGRRHGPIKTTRGQAKDGRR